MNDFFVFLQIEENKKNERNLQLENQLRKANEKIASLLSENEILYSDLIKKEEGSVEVEKEDINSSAISSEQGKSIEDKPDFFHIPHRLLENNEFSLIALMNKNATKKKIVNTFKKFIFMMVHDRFEDDPKSVNIFLDLESTDREKQIEG